MTTEDQLRRKLLQKAFKMPSVQTMVSRKSSITNAFVNAVIPAVIPTHDEVDEALAVLGLDPVDVRCAYCGDPKTEWDHLRPLVSNRRPTGFISEIANLVPACGKCNQSKGNKPWRDWMLSKAARSPTSRQIAKTAERIMRLEAYERWRTPVRVDIETIVSREDWEAYWALCEEVNADLRRHQEVADGLRAKITAHIRSPNIATIEQSLATNRSDSSHIGGCS